MPSSFKHVARRILRPITSPLDGRVADVNRRVTDVHRSTGEHRAALEERLDAIQGELGAYALTSGEADTFLGVELRRFAELLQEMPQQLREHFNDQEQRLGKRIDTLGHSGYVERLDRTASMPLKRLDGAAANLLNHASGHRGFAAQAGLWFNPPVTIELRQGSARLAGVNERIVEIPFAMRALARLQPGARILDIGAAESTFSLSAASLGYRVTALDLHPMPYAHPKLENVVGRFEDWDPDGERFDAAFLISTIEHVGLGAYGEPVGVENSDRHLMGRLRDGLLSEGGLVVLTTPYGAARQDALERTYDDDALARLLDGWELLERQIVVRRDERTWLSGDSVDDGTGGVAMVLARPAQPS